MVVCLTKYTTQKLITKPQSELTISPFDMKCKKLNLMWKTSGNVFSGHVAEWVFHIFPRLPSIMCLLKPEYSWVMLQCSVQRWSWSLWWQKIGNRWKLLSIVFTESFILNMMGLLDPAWKHINKFYLKVIKLFNLSKKALYSELTIKTPEWHLLLQFLTSNIFCNLFYCYYCWIRTNKCWLGLTICSFRQKNCFQ